MPQFSPGELKTARVPMTNPTGSAFDYLADLYMGTNLALMAETSFHLEALESKNISLPITMPTVAGTYPVYIGVFSGGVNIGLWRATEDVVIVPVAIAEFAYVSGVRHSRHMTIDCNAHRFEIDVKNVGNAAGVCSLVFHYRQRFETVDPPGVWFGWYAVTEPHYCYYTPMPCILEATLQPGETKTFLYDILISYVASHLQAYFTGDPGTSPTKKMRHTPRVHGGWWQE